MQSVSVMTRLYQFKSRVSYDLSVKNFMNESHISDDSVSKYPLFCGRLSFLPSLITRLSTILPISLTHQLILHGYARRSQYSHSNALYLTNSTSLHLNTPPHPVPTSHQLRRARQNFYPCSFRLYSRKSLLTPV